MTISCSTSRPKTEETIPKKRKINIAEIKEKRWTWNNEKLVTLIGQVIEYKSQRSYEGFDVETGLVMMYSDLQKMMALMLPTILITHHRILE